MLKKNINRYWIPLVSSNIILIYLFLKYSCHYLSNVKSFLFFFSFQRPLLIILDRNVDMATPLHHTWTYQALAHDVLELSLNRVVVEEGGGRSPGARPKTRACDLDVKDKFWVTHKGRLVNCHNYCWNVILFVTV